MPLTTIFDENDEFLWEFIETTTDEMGDLVNEHTVYDNGTQKTKLYGELGILTSKTELDSDVGDGVKKWSSRTTEYDTDGNKTSIATAFDDGRMKLDTFGEDGTKSTTVSDQSGDGTAFDWSFKETVRDADGKLAMKLTVFDDADITGTLFNAGIKANRLDIDGDNSHSWFAREYIFDENGVKIDTVFYDNFEDIPAFWFEMVAGAVGPA
jgi:hypothetical protein